MAQSHAHLLRRLNPHCVQALSAAASLCQARGHAQITLEHWLLKLLEPDDGDLGLIARRHAWNLDALWHGLLAHIDTLPRSLQDKPRLADNLQRLIKDAWLQVSLYGDAPHLRSVHLLGALLATPALLATDAAWPLLSLSQVQLQQLLPWLEAHSVEGASTPPDLDLEASSPTAAPPASLAVLERFTQDLTAKARAGAIDPVFGRDDEIGQLIDILARRRKNNPLLVGEPGVGKTALVEGLALRIAAGEVPDRLKPVSLRSLDLGLLQAGAGVKGEFEQRLKQLIDAVQQSPTPVLLFIDEAHSLIGAGNPAGGADAANLLKPALARGELRTIAATTWAEYTQYFQRDAALARRFQRISVDEPDDASACLMLRGVKARYAEHHGVHILDSAVRAAVSLSRRYLSGRQLPDKAVDLLDTASARVRMGFDGPSAPGQALRAECAALDLEREALEQDARLGAADTDERLAALAARHAAAQVRLEQLHAEPPSPPRQVGPRQIAEVIADWTGVPLGSLLKDQQANLLDLERQLRAQVIGQDAALGALARRLRAAHTGLTAESAPLGVFLLVGSSGVGKTATALALADSLFGGEKALLTINLSEYQEAHTVSQLKGAPPGYVGYGQGGILTEAVRQRPYCVVLLDEVEKAHRDVLNLFYQVFDRGIMRDGEGREIDFRHCVILMTSNLGGDALQAFLQGQPDAADSQLQALLYPTLRAHFQPALLARFQTLIYRPLPAAALQGIVTLKLDQLARRLQRHHNVACHIGAGLSDALVAACLLPDSGARNIDSLLDQQILPVLSQQLLERQAARQPTSAVRLGYTEEGGVSLEFMDR